MKSMGLECSRWLNHEKKSVYRGGDWICNLCRAPNYYWREKCGKCSNSRHAIQPNLSTLSSATVNHPPRSESNQQLCEINWPTSRQDQSLITGSSVAPTQGLQDSAWASHRYSPNIAQKSCPKYQASSVSNEHSYTSTSSLKSPVLSLPYQVQHYILSALEKILEEGCYDFALRWIPKRLSEIGCDCAEAFELSKWKSILPSEVPPNAFHIGPGNSILGALTNAVKIRNAAVHRHHFDIHTIRDMIKQAEQLMCMLSEITRMEKFRLLWTEVGEWANHSDDLQAARKRLELALQKVVERPIDDMDWTPNSALIEDASFETVPHEKNESTDDMMDIDNF